MARRSRTSYWVGSILMLIFIAGLGCTWRKESSAQLSAISPDTQTNSLAKSEEIPKMAANHLGSQTIGDVTLEMTRIFCEDSGASVAQLGVNESAFSVVHGNVPTVCIFF